MTVPDSNLDALLARAVSLTREAGALALARYNAVYGSRTKKDGTIVTDVDVELDRLIVEGLAGTGIPVLSEESAHDAASALADGAVWLVDPLDGTLDFTQGTGEFAVMLGLVERGEPVLGVVSVPAAGLLYYAAKGKGAYRESGGAAERIRVSDVARPAAARLVASRNHFNAASQALADGLGAVGVVRVGSNGIKLGRIAEGSAELFVTPTTRMGWWDVCAPQAIVEEAGGRVTGLFGERIRYAGPGVRNTHGIVATNGLLHDAALAALAAKRVVRE